MKQNIKGVVAYSWTRLIRRKNTQRFCDELTGVNN